MLVCKDRHRNRKRESKMRTKVIPVTHIRPQHRIVEALYENAAPAMLSPQVAFAARAFTDGEDVVVVFFADGTETDWKLNEDVEIALAD